MSYPDRIIIYAYFFTTHILIAIVANEIYKRIHELETKIESMIESKEPKI
jgi:hypothetical protein